MYIQGSNYGSQCRTQCTSAPLSSAASSSADEVSDSLPTAVCLQSLSSFLSARRWKLQALRLILAPLVVSPPTDPKPDLMGMLRTLELFVSTRCIYMNSAPAPSFCCKEECGCGVHCIRSQVAEGWPQLRLCVEEHLLASCLCRPLCCLCTSTPPLCCAALCMWPAIPCKTMFLMGLAYI